MRTLGACRYYHCYIFKVLMITIILAISIKMWSAFGLLAWFPLVAQWWRICLPMKGDAGDKGSIPGLGRSSGGRHGNPFQHSCLENPMDRGALLTAVLRVAMSWTWLKWPSMHAGTRQAGWICPISQHMAGGICWRELRGWAGPCPIS